MHFSFFPPHSQLDIQFTHFLFRSNKCLTISFPLCHIAKGTIKGRNVEEKLGHIDRFLNSLQNQNRRPVLLTLIMMRKKIKKFFNSREVVLIIEGKTNKLKEKIIPEL